MKPKKVFFGLSGGLGPVSRTIPIAQELERMIHCEVAFSVYGTESEKVIQNCGYSLLPDEGEAYPSEEFIFPSSTMFYNLDHYYSQLGFLDFEFTRSWVYDRVEMLKRYKPDIVFADMSPQTLIAAKYLKIPCVSITQSCFYPEGEPVYSWGAPPRNLAKTTPIFNKILHDLSLPLINKVEELNKGDLTILPSFPELDPVTSTDVHYVGPIMLNIPPPSSEVPFPLDQPYILVYPGRLYDSAGASGEKVVKAVSKAFQNTPYNIVIATREELGEELSTIVNANHNFYQIASFTQEMLSQCELFIHHGGHSSCLSAVMNGVPSLILPTHVEREFNARKMQKLNVADYMLPEYAFPPHLYQLAMFMIGDYYASDTIAFQEQIRQRQYGGAKEVCQLVKQKILGGKKNDLWYRH
ncbi:glycosyltransferase [Fictibacillus enclensis]|uniref:glycosyltransferase n=1 Tax=Fictibacillus enclensis TaxID=1017270 RepID=UPI0025A2538C|nr:nucleotide disphospho-sugar-binding domain-containing protein [Fictibacillus enclensis]MDM5335691.1 glycosyltransferase [Fictibacillus enclensis]